MKLATKCLLLSLMTILLGACAAPVRHETASGRPEVTIRGKVGNQVQAEIANLMLNRRYSVKSSSPNILVFEKPFDNAMASVLFASQYDVTPYARITYNVFEIGDSTRIVASFAAITNPGSAFERVTPLDNNPDTLWYQTKLNEIKQRIEAGK